MTREELLGRDTAIRLECLTLAHGDVRMARQLYVFVTGQSDKSPKQKIDDALEEAGVR